MITTTFIGFGVRYGLYKRLIVNCESDGVRWWYQRNGIIYWTLSEISTLPDDRTLLIIGAELVHLVTHVFGGEWAWRCGFSE
ncbi:DUF5694 domain-containing protein [Rossellomorea arthrocnemi]|uniref:DUF5694 domain-containing protein n=1 Tax=Rossellomorea arthrocnemi TaxID=2769542 RepID=UPI002EDB025A